MLAQIRGLFQMQLLHSSRRVIRAVPNVATIDVEEAKRIALDHAGIVADAVKHMNAYLEYDDGMEQYEVQFYEGTTEYEYSIDAVNGTVLGYNMESIFS